MNSRSDVIQTESEGAPVLYAFAVHPAWWQRAEIRVMGLMILLAVLFGILRLRTYQLENDRKRLEEAVCERSQQLKMLNEELREASLTDPLTGTAFLPDDNSG